MRGLSFIEMLVTLAIFGLIMAAVTDSVLFFYRANTSSLEQGQQVENARRGAELFVRDVRESTYGDDGAYPIATMASSSVTFFSDTDLDGAVEKIKYTLIGTRLYRNVTDPTTTNPPQYLGGGATSTVSEYVRNFDENSSLFRYYNASSTEITNSQFINTVVSVTVNLVVDIVQKHTPGKFTLTESATLRNLRAQ